MRADVAVGEGRLIRVRGIVQGVGFRPWVYRLAHENGITGEVRNDDSGVTIAAFGTTAALERFLFQMRTQQPAAAEITALDWTALEGAAPRAFTIAVSAQSARRRLTIAADIATCEQCSAEVADPQNRRYRYAFTNCTNCGPRFSIVRDVPYDRTSTTMTAFTMCPQCAHEYTSVIDRRFHAEPNACPACGPQLTLRDASGNVIASADPITTVAQILRDGAIVAIKGIGGFHLACDARSDDAVAALRQRKRRDFKPFAVMVRDLVEARGEALIDEESRRLLLGPAHPIVLVRRHADSTLSRLLAPGNPFVGLLLPYTPLHRLLLDSFDGPLVMTSGNVSEEPIAYANDEALQRLRGIAHAFLLHDREIATRTDDSVARVIGNRPTLLRRSRGYVPRPVQLKTEALQPILACGAQLKNTFCVLAGDEAYLGPHVGDLDNVETYTAYETSIDLMERLLAVKPAAIAHDLHPDYLSTRYARERGIPRVAVQHHHAHIASVMAEHGVEGPVIGVAFDGTGYGTDGAAWGGEVLLAHYERFERIATLRPLALAGGDTAIRQVWRIALAALMDAFDGTPPPLALSLLRNVETTEVETVRRMIARGFNAPLAHGAGRYFDAVGALALNMPQARYEGEVAMMLEFAHDGEREQHLAYGIDFRTEPWQIDLRPTIRETVALLLAGAPAGTVSSRFHTTLIHATCAVVRAAVARHGTLPVALTGGCFQNAHLAEGLTAELRALEVLRNEQVPPGDGGIALGQAVIANAVLRERQGATA